MRYPDIKQLTSKGPALNNHLCLLTGFGDRVKWVTFEEGLEEIRKRYLEFSCWLENLF